MAYGRMYNSCFGDYSYVGNSSLEILTRGGNDGKIVDDRIKQ